MNKKDAIAEFRECVGNSYRGDAIARREAWKNFVDTLQRDGLITERQAYRWSLPF